MTCVVGIAEKGVVYMGGDSIAIDAGGYAMHVRETPKVFRNGPFLIGCAGSFRMADTIRYRFAPHLPTLSEDLHAYMATTFVDALRETCKAHAVSSVENNVEEVDGEIIVGIYGRLFVIGCDFEVGQQAGGFASIGSGSSVALGALHATRKQLPRKRLTAALEAAQAFNAGVRGPFSFATIRRGTMP